MTIKHSARRALGAALLLTGLTTGAMGMTTAEQRFVCPIGGESFSQVMAMSGTSFGMMLDLRPIGALQAPGHWRNAPGNGFVIFRQDLSEAEVATLTPVVASEEYQRLRRTEVTYALATYLAAALGLEERRQAHMLLQATWQSDGDPRASGYRARVLDLLERGAKPADPREAIVDQAVAGEMERRLGRFEAAERRFTALQSQPPAPLSEVEQRIVRYQLRLIAQRDSAPHQVPKKDGDETSDAPPPAPRSPIH